MSQNIGHNNPPAEMPTEEQLKSRLEIDHKDVLARAKKLIEASDRCTEPANDEEAGKITDYIGQINKAKKALEDGQKKEKAPFLTLGRVVDGLFKREADKLDVAKAKPQKFLNAWLQKKDDEAREAARIEAERLKKEADERAAEAAKLEAGDMNKEADKALTQAVRIDNTAQRYNNLATGRTSLGVARGAEGSTAGQRKVWVAVIEEPAKVDLEALRPYFTLEAVQQAANAFMRAGGRELAGVTIKETVSAVVR